MYRKKGRGWTKHIDFMLLDVLCMQIAFIVSYIWRFGLGNPYIDIIKTILVVLLALFLTSLFLSFSREFEFLKNKLLPANIRKFVNKYTIGIGSVLVMGISISLSILCI